MKIISIFNEKGGIGKSTIAQNLATYLAAMGFNTVIIGGDSQGNAESLNARPYDDGKTLLQVVIQDLPLEQAMYQIRKRLWVVPAHKNLSAAASWIDGKKDMNYMRRIFKKFTNSHPTIPYTPDWFENPSVNMNRFSVEMTTDEEYRQLPEHINYVIIDNPPHPDMLTYSLILASHGILVPLEMDPFSFQGFVQMVDDLKTRFEFESTPPKIIGFVPSNMDHENEVGTEYLKVLWKTFRGQILPPIHHDKNIRPAQGMHRSILEFYRPSRASRELCGLSLQLIGYKGDLEKLRSCEKCDTAIEEIEQVLING